MSAARNRSRDTGAPRSAAAIICSSGARQLVREQCAALAHAFGRAGVAVVVRVGLPAERHETPILVEPGALAADGLDVAGRLDESACISLARPFTSELAADIPLLAGAACGYACSFATARLARLRVPGVRHLPFGFDLVGSGWDGRERVRPVDVAFIGHGGGERLWLLGNAARELDRHAVEVHVSRLGDPVLARPRAELLRTTQLVILASPGEGNAVDILELAEAAAAGAVALVVDPGDLGPWRPGEHLLATSELGLADAIRRALAAPGRLAEIRARARALAARHASTAHAAEKLVRELALSLAGPEFAVAPPAAAAPVPRLGRKLRELSGEALQRTVGWPLRRSAGWGDSVPEISVVIPVLNGARTVAAAVESALDAAGKRVEVIVVDDCSRDATRAVVRAVMERRHDDALMLIERPWRGGPAAARNDGFALARGALGFALDADNALLPHGLQRLAGALECNPDAAFAYGYCETHDAVGTVGLANTEEWEPKLFRHGNFVDAGALFRAELWRRLGGYDERFVHGWEDFEYWLRCAAAGLAGVHAHAIVYRYALRTDSRSSGATEHAPTTLALLAESYAGLLGMATGVPVSQEAAS